MAPPTSEQAMSNRPINDPDVSDDLCSCGGLPHWAEVAEELEKQGTPQQD